MNFSFKTRHGNDLLPEGYEIAYEQLQFKVPMKDEVDLDKIEKLNLTQNKNVILLSNNDFSFTIDKKEGVPTSYIYKGVEMLAGAMRPNFWRAPTLNDDVDWNGRRKWEQAGLDSLELGNKFFEVNRIDKGTVEVCVDLEFLNKEGELVLKTNQLYLVNGNGKVDVMMTVMPTALVTTFPKIGTQLRMPLGFDKVRYFGKDTENYPDRDASGRVGVYERNAGDFFEMHEEPQESGNRTGVRWFEITDAQNNGIRVSCGEEHLNFSIYQYSDEALTKAERINQITPADFWTVNIDYRQAPLGTATCGPGALDKYLIKNEIYEYSFTISPLKNKF